MRHAVDQREWLGSGEGWYTDVMGKKRTRGRPAPWRTIRSKIVYENPWMRVRHDDVIKPDGKPGIYGVVEKPPFVLIVPRYRNRWYFVRQYRYAVRKNSLEFPQGDIQRGTSSARSAARELEEEAGLRIVPGHLKRLGHLDLGPGHHTQTYFVFLADRCTPGSRHLEASESDMKVVSLTTPEVLRAIKNGKLTDAHSIAAFFLAQRMKRK